MLCFQFGRGLLLPCPSPAQLMVARLARQLRDCRRANRWRLASHSERLARARSSGACVFVIYWFLVIAADGRALRTPTGTSTAESVVSAADGGTLRTAFGCCCGVSLRQNFLQLLEDARFILKRIVSPLGALGSCFAPWLRSGWRHKSCSFWSCFSLRRILFSFGGRR